MKRLGLSCALALAWVVAVAGEPFRVLDQQVAHALADTKSYAAPTIVALWSTDCPYCKGNLKLFTDMVKLDPRLRLITVATEPVSEDVTTTLNRLRVPGKRFAYGSEAAESLAYAVDLKWRGELPRTLFFDGRGGRTALSGAVDEAAARCALGL